MAKSNEIVQIEEIDKGLTKLNVSLGLASENYLKLVKSIADNTQLIKDNAVSVEGLGKAQKKTKEEGEKLDALGKQLQASEEKLKQLTDERTQTLVKNRLEIQKVTKEQKDKLKADQAEEGSLVRMRQKLIELNQAYDKSGTRTKAAADEINKLSKEIQQAEFSTNRHQRNVGNYADAIGGLPGPIGNATSSIMGMGKQLWALVANPVGAFIAAIIGGLALLYKAFTSTDSGATAMASTLKAIGNVMDILIDRAMSYYKMLWSLVTFDWDGVKKNATDAFQGIGTAIKDAAKAGWDYEQQMDRIGDREAASLPRIEKLRKEYVELSIASKNRLLGTKEQIRLAELAVKKEFEANGIELGFVKERTEAEKNNLASKINNTNLTVEAKRKQIDEWLKLDDTQIESAQQNSEAFAEFYNKNEAEFQAMQKMKAEEIGKESEANENSRRIQTALLSFKSNLYNEDAKNREDKQKEEEDKIKASEKTKAEAIIKGLDEQSKAINESLKDDEAIAEMYFDNKIKMADDEFDRYLKREQDKVDATEKAADEKLKAEKKLADDTIKEEQDKAEKIKEIQFEMASELMNGLFERNASKLDNELSNLEKEKEAKLSNENLTKEEKIRIEEEYDKKVGAIKTKQAKADKLQALFNIALNTAMGSMKAVAEFPITGGMPFLAWVIASGALQAALVASQPIPQFEDGTNFAPSKGLFGEAGRELMFLRSGETILADSPTYFEGSKFKGAQIKSNAETERMISASQYPEFTGRTMTDDRLLNEMRSVRKAILSKPVNIVDKENRFIGYQVGSHTEIYINKLKKK